MAVTGSTVPGSSLRIPIVLFIVCSTLMKMAAGHGRLFDPPSRSSAWRVGFNTPRDYNDMEAFCGGFERQWLVNRGRCGICGDPYDEAIKPHEAPGGIFATGTIVRQYRQGQIVMVTLQLTATHKGFYEFKLCPNNNPQRDPSQECFERFPLRFVDDSGRTRFFLNNLQPATYRVRLQLPPEVTCSQCILQWTYTTGNRWGICPNGTGALGCGPQETFRACSDIAILASGVAPTAVGQETTPPAITITPPSVVTMAVTPGVTGTPVPPTDTTPLPTDLSPVTSASIGPVDFGTPPACLRYVPVGLHLRVGGMDNWCENNCRLGYCPQDFCRCMDQK